MGKQRNISLDITGEKLLYIGMLFVENM